MTRFLLLGLMSWFQVLDVLLNSRRCVKDLSRQPEHPNCAGMSPENLFGFAHMLHLAIGDDYPRHLMIHRIEQKFF